MKESLVKFKIWFQRGAGYLAILNTGLILLVFLKNYGVVMSAKLWIGIIYVVGTALLVLVGYLDDKLGFYKAEVSKSQEQDLRLEQIQKDIEAIKVKL